jgi:replicative DNA helicase
VSVHAFQQPPPLENVRAEHTLLGILLTHPQYLTALPPSFAASHYASAEHRDIHEAIVHLGRPGHPALLAVVQALAPGDPERRKYVTSLVSAPPSFTKGAAVQAAEIVTDMHRRRVTEGIARDLLASVRSPSSDGSCQPALSAAMCSLDGLFSTCDAVRGPVSLDDAMDDALRRADEAYARGGPAGVSTGMRSVDEALGGLEPSCVYIVAGRPGMGKSSIGHQWAISAARDGYDVLEISQEMSAAELGRRALCAVARAPIIALKRGNHERYADALVRARRELNGLPVTIEDVGGLNVAHIAQKARALQRAPRGKNGLGLIMVDHLHITPPDAVDARQNDTMQVGKISNAFKRLAKELQVPVLLLAQLSRGPEARDDKRPTLADLRQSGAIEQDADAVCFVYREEYYMQVEPQRSGTESPEAFANRLSVWTERRNRARGQADLIIAKLRDGAPSTVPLTFDGPTTSFAEIAP